jgi:peptide/nickel transport system substrate-binding protein
MPKPRLDRMTKPRFKIIRLLAATLLFTLAAQPQAARAEDSTLRVSLNTELQILDPIITTINATRVFAHMVFDTLVGVDSKGVYRPQMLQGWTVSDDRMRWTFTLRDGLAFSDGKPVTSDDCIASIKRWATKEAMGRQLMDAAESMTVIDAKTFALKLNRPYGFVLEALGKPGHQIPVIMPKRLADLPSDKPVPEIVGSGPYIFRQDLWRPGNIAVLDRNPAYQPRPEPADALAGGKVAKMEHVQLISIPDQATRVAALQANEVDMLEIVPADFIPVLRADPNVTIGETHGADQIMAIIVLNHAQPPFNNPKIRQAAQTAINQADVMAALGLPDDMYLKNCESLYMCNAPLSSAAGTQVFRDAGAERAKQLLKEAGYHNEPIAFLHASSSALLNPIGLVVADQLRQAGFNVDLRTSDYATVAQRRFSREPVEKGGWSVVPLIANGIDMVNPLSNLGISYNCIDGQFGWYCDPEITPLLKQLSLAKPEDRQAIADKLQERFHQNVNVILGGQFAGPPAYRSELKGVMAFSFPLLWNIERVSK